MPYSKLHLAKCLWEMKRDEASLIVALDKMTISRSLYQKQAFLGNKTNVKLFNELTPNSNINAEDAGYTDDLEKYYNG